MPKLEIILSDALFNALKQELIIKQVCGSLFGIEDSFVAEVMKTIQDGKTNLALELKAK